MEAFKNSIIAGNLKGSKSCLNVPVIDISSEHFAAQLIDNGYSIKDIFFKCRKSSVYKKYAYMFGEFVDDICEYKHHYTAERAIVVYYGSDPLEGEFKQLLKIYNIAPKNTAKPIAIAKYENETVGYFLEYINGRPLYTFEFEFKKDVILNALIPLLDSMHSNRIGHGDINIGGAMNNGNIIIANNNTIKLIDPLPTYDGIDDNFRMDQDRMEMMDLVHIIRKLE